MTAEKNPHQTKTHWLDRVTERNDHSMSTVTNPGFIQHRNINSTFSENVYIALGTGFAAAHDRGLIYLL